MEDSDDDSAADAAAVVADDEPDGESSMGSVDESDDGSEDASDEKDASVDCSCDVSFDSEEAESTADDFPIDGVDKVAPPEVFDNEFECMQESYADPTARSISIDATTSPRRPSVAIPLPIDDSNFGSKICKVRLLQRSDRAWCAMTGSGRVMEKVASRFSETPTQNAMCEETMTSARCENTSMEIGASVRASAMQALSPTAKVVGDDDDDELSRGSNDCPANPNQPKCR